MEQFFMTLRAKQFLTKYDVIKGEDGNPIIHYSFDYTSRFDCHNYISLMEPFDECALLYQLEKSYPEGKNYDIDSVNSALVFVDFENVFNAKAGNAATEIDLGSYTEEDLSPYSKKITNNIRLQYLFRYGFQIKYSEDLTITYIPFEKSNSMARHNKMSFVASELYDEVNKRLNLDIAFDTMQLTLSKFFAYKGLYLSSAQRVSCDELILNEKTVVVINDIYFHAYNQSVITADDNEKIIEKSNYDMKVENAFDGEGIISPKYANLINHTLFPDETETNATSFQIRMPFSKGMLHQVDFLKFFSKEARLNPENGYYIKDAFGIVRDLKDAHIIMSETMFKAYKWIRTQKNVEDPMKYYFDKFRKYDHALYITNTNLGIRRVGTTKLGYQLLNTLKLTKKQMDAIAQEHLKQSDDPITYLLNSPEASDEKSVWISALSKSHVVAHDRHVKSELLKVSNGLKSASGEGKFLVEGEIRYLSRDLLHFLTRLLRLMHDYRPDEKLKKNYEKIEKLNLFSDKFYMPDNILDLSTDTPCAIFRSPHLSRNEQCLLRNFDADSKSIYHKYFSHLSGIIMVAFKSLDPQALGGADFDGDMVKVITNEHIVNAVADGAYKLNKQNKYVRSLPIILIPSREGKTTLGCDYKSADYFNTIKNTFSSRVGKISNMAIRLGQKQYSDSDTLEHSCVECTILTGLEIDAAKSGVHPDLTELIDYCSSLKFDFEYLDDFHDPLLEYNEQPQHYKPFIPNLSSIEEDNAGDDDYIHPLALLPGYYKEYAEKHWKPDILDNEKVNGRFQYFTFSGSNAWRKELNTKLIKEINAVTTAYNNVIKISRKVNKYVVHKTSSTYAGHIYNTFKKQYDAETADEIYDEIYIKLFHILDAHFTSVGETEAALVRLKNSNWPFLLQEHRKSALSEILSLEKGQEEDEVFSCLLNFNARGYYLLYYVLNDMLNLKTRTATTEENAEYYRNNIETDFSDIDETQYKKSFNICYDFYIEQTSLSVSGNVWRNALRRKCLRHIKNMIESSPENEDFVKTMFAAKDRDFFWDSVTIEDLTPYLFIQEETQC